MTAHASATLGSVLAQKNAHSGEQRLKKGQRRKLAVRARKLEQLAARREKAANPAPSRSVAELEALKVAKDARQAARRKERKRQRKLEHRAALAAAAAAAAAAPATRASPRLVAAAAAPAVPAMALAATDAAGAEPRHKKRKRSRKPEQRATATGGAAAITRASPRLAAAAAAATVPTISLDAPAAPAPASAPAPLPPFVEPPWSLSYDLPALEAALQPLLDETVVGVDIEWRPTFMRGQPANPVALLQLSSLTHAVLVPVRHLQRLPPSLKALLSADHIWKVGCGATEDARKIKDDCGLVCSPTLEIGEAAARLQAVEGLTFPNLPPEQKVTPGLKGMTLACGHELRKSKSVTRSNWERRTLSAEQQRYAALDAYAGAWITHCVCALHGGASKPGGLAGWLGEQAAALEAVRRARRKKRPRPAP